MSPRRMEAEVVRDAILHASGHLDLKRGGPEIDQNKARVDDAAPFNQGLHDVIAQRQEQGGIGSVSEFIAIMDSYNVHAAIF